MRRTIAAMSSLAVALLGVPASAAGDVEGTVKMQFNMGFDMEPCPGVTWVGTLEIGGSESQDGSYGLVLSSTGEHGVYRGDAYLFEEDYTVMTEPLQFDENGVVTACSAGEVVLSGWGAGVRIVPKGEFWVGLWEGFIIEGELPPMPE